MVNNVNKTIGGEKMKSSSKKRLNTAVLLVLAFAIPFVILCIAFAYRGLVPFGDHSVFMWDSKLQYKDYFGYLWDVLHGNASLSYSASKSLGGQMAGLVAYYLTCPLNLLMYFFDKSQIGLFLSVETILKMAFAGVTAGYFLKKRYNINSAVVLILSTCYALMEYNIYYCRNIMWLDGAVMLPLAALGAYELLHNNKKGLLFFSVAVTIISNWYSGFMVCLMTGFYFLFEFVLKYDWKNFKSIVGKAFGDCVKFGADMILGVMASAAVLLPALLSLVGGKAAFRLIYASMNFSFLYTFKGFDINSTINTKESPILYIGGIVLLFVAYYLFDKRVDIKTKICSAALFVFMIFGFCFKEFELMWTAFVQSHSYNYRFAFVFGFVMIMLAGRAVETIKLNGDTLDKPAVFKALALIAGVTLLLDLQNAFNNRFIANAYLFIFVFYALFLFGVYCTKNSNLKKAVSTALIALFAFGELGVNAVLAFKDYDMSDNLYTSYTEQMKGIVGEMKEKDNSFYRFEKNYSYLTETGSECATCEPLLFGYNSIEHYSSTYDRNVDEFLAAMGYADSTYIPDENSKDEVIFPTDTYWNSPMIMTETLLGVKYELAQKKTFGMSEFDMESEMPSGYSMYVNEKALPMAYNVSADAKTKPDYTLNPFENQQKFVSSLTGEDTALYENINPELKEIKNGWEKYTAVAETDGPMYFYTDGTDAEKAEEKKNIHKDNRHDNCELYVNGEYVQNTCQRFLLNAVYLGDFKAGDTVDIQLKHVSKNKNEHDKQHLIYVSQLNESVYNDVCDKLSAGSKTDLNINGNKISGSYTTDSDSLVMLTIPYAEGWTVKVDGEKTEYKELSETFIGLELSAGEHQIEMEYHTPSQKMSNVISVFGVFAFAVWCGAEYIIKKKKSK